MKNLDVAIVGAGLTGLSAGVILAKAGASVCIFEKEAAVGGRVRSTYLDGFILDHGFQVVLSAYPELRSIVDLSDLNAQPFWSGCLIHRGGKKFKLLNPLRHGVGSFSSLLCPLISTKDKFLLVRLWFGLGSENFLNSHKSTYTYLKELGFSKTFLESFFVPFFGGIFLDRSLSSDSSLFKFFLKCFLAGDAMLLKSGVQSLPDFLASRIGSENIRLSCEVKEYGRSFVVLESGERIVAKAVIQTTDVTNVAFNKTKTIYFAAPQAPYSEPLITLNGDSQGVINNLCIPSNVQPSYAPQGASLISVSILGQGCELSHDDLERQVRSEMRAYFGSKVDAFHTLKIIDVPRAVPTSPLIGDGFAVKDGVILANDFLSYGSQNGAIKAGKGAAEHALQFISS